jgi:hypothetical protein
MHGLIAGRRAAASLARKVMTRTLASGASTGSARRRGLSVKGGPFGPGKNPAAVALGRLGGRKTSPAKARAARRNGRKGGRPRKTASRRHP